MEMSDKDDCISRQAALDAIKAWYADYPLDLQEPIDDCWNSVRELPAVQPDHNADVSKKVEWGDCISRQAALDAVNEYATIWMSYTDDMSASDIAQEALNSAKSTMIRILKEQPSVQPEIIQCKDCRYFLRDTEYGYDWCNRMSGVFRMKSDDFCSKAERRTDG